MAERKEVLAINLYDTERLDSTLKKQMLAGRMDAKYIDMRFDRGKEADEAAVAFKCDLLTAAVICDTLRSRDREMGDSPTRLYLKRGNSWSRVPSRVVLTIVVKGKCQLNPEVFPIEVCPSNLIPLPTKGIII